MSNMFLPDKSDLPGFLPNFTFIIPDILKKTDFLKIWKQYLLQF